MARNRSRLARLLALLLQWGTAFAHCLRPLAAAAGRHSIEIRTAEGLKTVPLEDGGRPAEKPAAGQAVCPGAGRPAALEPPAPALVHKPDDGHGAAAVAVVQAVRRDTGLPSRVIRLSTEQPTRASVFWPGRVRARRRRPMMAL